MQVPAVPPAVPARLRPPRFGINRRMGNLAGLPVLLVPDPAAGFQGGAVDRRGPAVVGPRLEHGHQVPPEAANQAGQVRWQAGDSPLPGPASRKAAVLVQERP